MNEYRAITIDAKSLFRAVVDFRQRRREPLPSGEVKRFELTEKPTVVATYFLEDLHGNAHTLRVESAELTAAMIAHFMGRRVPIPRNSSKELMVVGDELVMAMKVAAPGQGGPARRRPISARPGVSRPEQPSRGP